MLHKGGDNQEEGPISEIRTRKYSLSFLFLIRISMICLFWNELISSYKLYDMSFTLVRLVLFIPGNIAESPAQAVRIPQFGTEVINFTAVGRAGGGNA